MIKQKIKRAIETQGVDYEKLRDLFDVVSVCEDKAERREWLLYVRKMAREVKSADAYELIHLTYVKGAQDGNFDDYCIALEWYRDPEKRFYLPRRDVLKVLVDDLQDLYDGKLDFLGVSLPPRVGKSTLCIFFMTFVMGNRPDVASVMSGHSDKLTDGFYRELLSIITDDTQYAWQEIFAGVKLVDNSAKNETIDLERKKRFPTITCRSISGTLTGAVEIGTGGVLYCDDLIEDLEESLNPVRLQSKYDAYLNQLKDRKKLGAVELMVGTRWNVADPLGRIEEQYRGNDRYRFRVIPALDEDGESNFNYKYGLGFDTEYYRDMKDSIDDATWMAKYMGNPYIREGLLFPAAELRYYNGVLPDGEPDRKVAVVDTAWGGGDSLSMPILYECDGSWYLPDVVFNNGDKTVTRPLVIGKLKQHHPHMVRWESNNGGDEYGGIVDEKLREDGVRINMSYKKAPTTQSKLSRIIQYAPDIKKIYFLDEKSRSPEYEKFMREVTTFTVSGKNLHDDAPDSLAMLVDFVTAGVKMVTVAQRPF
jgi:predicted phage terminase large subunit-like protein